MEWCCWGFLNYFFIVYCSNHAFIFFFSHKQYFPLLYSPVADAGGGCGGGGRGPFWGRFPGSVISQSSWPERSRGLGVASWSAQRQCGVKSLQISASWKKFWAACAFFPTQQQQQPVCGCLCGWEAVQSSAVFWDCTALIPTIPVLPIANQHGALWTNPTSMSQRHL